MIWKILKFFNRYENWGDPDKMDPIILFLIDGFRDSLPSGYWIKVHSGFDGTLTGHSKTSQHYPQPDNGGKSKAVDFHVVGCHILEAESHLHKYLKSKDLVDSVGLGIYPDWNNPGFHLDVRGKYARWGFINPKDGEEKQSISYNEALNIIRRKDGQSIKLD